MATDRKKFAEPREELSDKEKNLINVITKVLSKREGESIKKFNEFTESVHDMTMAVKDSGSDQSKESKNMVKDLQKIFEATNGGKKSQFELNDLAKKLGNIQDIIKHSDNVQGSELEHMEKLIAMTKERVNEGRASNMLIGTMKDSFRTTVDNAVDINAIATGLFTNSPLVSFLTKTVGDLGKGLMNKRKAIREENTVRLAEQLNEYQEDAHKQREKLLDQSNEPDKDDDKTQKVEIDNDSDLVKVEVVTPELDKLFADMDAQEVNVNLDRDEQEVNVNLDRDEQLDAQEVNVNVNLDRDEQLDEPPLSRIRDEDPIDTRFENALPGDPNGELIGSLLREQELTNELLERYVNFMVAGSVDDLENKKESDAKSDKLMRMFGKKKGTGTKVAPKGEGMLSKLLGSAMIIPSMAGITALFTTVSTFITATLVPAITGFFSAISALALPILAIVGIVTAVYGFFDGFINAGEKLGKTDVSIVERFIAGIGGIWEMFLGIGDMIFGFLGFNTDMKGWFNDHITRPIAKFMDSLNLEELFADAFGLISYLPRKMYESAKKLISFFWKYSPINLLMDGLKYINEKVDFKKHIMDGIGMAMDFVKNFDVFDIITLPIRTVFSFLDEKFNIVDKIKTLMKDFNIMDRVQAIKDSILKFIPDFLLDDKQEARKNAIAKEANPEKYSAEEMEEKGKDLVQNQLHDKGVIDYNRYGNSTVENWDDVEKLDKKQLQMMVSYDDWDDSTKKRLESLSQDAPLKHDYNDVPKSNVEAVAMDMVGKGTREQRKPLIVEMAPTHQPMAQHNLSKTSNIDNYQKILDEGEKVAKEMPMMPNINQSQQVNQHASYNIPAMPYIQDQGIRGLQATFAS